jgi:hypothetical protein
VAKTLMAWEQMAQAILALNGWENMTLHLREDGSWYVSDATEIRDGGCLVGVSGNGSTPQEAIEDHWYQLTDLETGQYIVLRAMKENRRAVKWNGFMWADVNEELELGRRKKAEATNA